MGAAGEDRAGRVRSVVTTEALDVAEHVAYVQHATAGAVSCFTGVIRDHDHGRCVVGIEYQAHPTAEAVLALIAEEAASRFTLGALAVTHRVGNLTVGDVALVAAVSSAHRHEAFAACQSLVEEVKRRLPVWKHQLFADGSSEWVACP